MSKKIFVLDDEYDMTLLTGQLLGFHGFQVTSANHSADGLAELLENDFDGIIMDLMMPGLDGLSVIRKLRASPRHSKTPILVVSAKRIDDLERKFIIDHGIRFASKPISPKQIVLAVEEFFHI